MNIIFKKKNIILLSKFFHHIPFCKYISQNHCHCKHKREKRNVKKCTLRPTCKYTSKIVLKSL